MNNQSQPDLPAGHSPYWIEFDPSFLYQQGQRKVVVVEARRRQAVSSACQSTQRFRPAFDPPYTPTNAELREIQDAIMKAPVR